MTDVSWPTVERVLDAILDAPVTERGRLLDRLCAGQPGLRKEVESLLKAGEASGDYLDESAGMFAAPFLIEALENEQSEMLVNERIGAYRLIEEVGRGGMGVVYRAVRADGSFEREVAVKLIKRGMDSRQVLERFQRERSILARLQHPHIGRLFDAGMSDAGRPYFVMEFVEGRTITTYCEEEGLDIDARLPLFLDVCKAVGYAHRNLVVHRDLKPGNIRVNRDGTVKLLDFGIAKMLEDEEETPITRTGAFLLTPEYAAPEQVVGEPITTATDVYSLGVILYELLAGERPYDIDRSTPSAVERAVCGTEPPRPSTRVRSRAQSVALAGARVSNDQRTRAVRRTLRGDLDTIVMTALRKQPDRRYASVEALADDIKRYIEHRPILARRESLLYRTVKFAGRHRAAVSSAAVLFLALNLGVWLYLTQITRERDRARQEAEKAQAIAGFMRDLFAAANPEQAQGRTVDARQLLDLGFDKLESELSEQPEIRASLVAEMGRAYSVLGSLERADSLLAVSIDDMTRLPDPPQPEIARALFDRAWTRDQTGDLDTAERLYRASIQAWTAVGGKQHPEAARAAAVLGGMYAYTGRMEESERLLIDACRTLEETVGIEDQRTQVALHNLAYLYSQKGDSQRATEAYGRILEVGERVLGTNHPDNIATLGSLALSLKRTGRLDEAEIQYREAIARASRVFGPDHMQVATPMNNLAKLLFERERYAEADSLYGAAERIFTSSSGGDDTRASVTRANRGLVKRALGEKGRAEALFRQALAVQRDALPQVHGYTASTLVGLGALLLDLDRLEEADRLLAEALDMRQSLYPPEHVGLAEVYADLGLLHIKRGQIHRADSLLGVARTIVDAQPEDASLKLRQRIDARLALLEDGTTP